VRLRHVAGLALATLVLAACSDDGGGPAPSGSTEPPFDGKVSPLTGLKLESTPDNPVYYVKIENTHGGVPQYGENKADMMIEELVEGGVTRLVGLFYTDLPTRVGHVRSARTTDIALSEPVGASIVASGAALVDPSVQVGDTVVVDVRGRREPFDVVKPPFLEASTKEA